MLDPTGIMAVVNGFIAFYNAVQSFIRYLREMLEVVNSFVVGVAELARGNVTIAANFLESSLARAMPIAIGFLANQVGLSGIGRRIGEMIERVRALVDRALTWLVDRAVSAGTSFLNAIGIGRGSDQNPQHNPEKQAHIDTGLGAIATEEARYSQNGKINRENADRVAATVRQNHPVFSSFDVVDGGDSWKYRYSASPSQTVDNPATAKAEGDETNTEPEFGSVTGDDYGTSVKVAIMKKPRTGGSRADSSLFTDNYRILNQRMQGRRRFYVRGHLLNNHLGGTGREWKNLTPLFQNTNSQHNAKFERLVKKAYNADKVIKDFEVRAVYGRSQRAVPASVSEENRDKVRNLLRAETKIPSHLECKADIMKQDGSGVEEPLRPDPIVNNVDDQDITMRDD
jgi:hypothetical protein